MADKLTPRATDYSKWYNELVINADLAEHSAVRGCMVIKPYGFAIWEIQQEHPIKKGLLTKGNQHSFELYFETPLIDVVGRVDVEPIDHVNEPVCVFVCPTCVVNDVLDMLCVPW